MTKNVEDVLGFWFESVGSSNWYAQSDDLDRRIERDFEATLRAIVAGETAHWRDEARGRLAEIIVLDQFSRNMYRGTPAAFANDPLALALAQEAIRNGADRALEDAQRAFLYMPYMHSESAQVHEHALALFADLPNLGFEREHKAIIDRFGRYPHRNEVLGRPSTAEEIEWMATHPGF